MKDPDLDLIEKYVRNEMLPAERLGFEARIAADPQLLERVTATRLMAEGIRRAAEQPIRLRAEAARDRYHRKSWWHPFSLNGWIMGGGVLFLAGLFWLGYLYFWQPDTGGLPGTDKTEKQSAPRPDIATGTSGMKDDNLSMVGEEVLFSQKIKVVQVEKPGIEKEITVNIYRDNTLQQTHYLYQNDLLNFYLPVGVNLSYPPVLVRRGEQMFIRTPGGESLLIQNEAPLLLEIK